ncbi:MAG: hypothetical protein JWP97_5215 [Labilithrix sp.]|nr:hypothetical protein [Labilithrix sp.]
MPPGAGVVLVVPEGAVPLDEATLARVRPALGGGADAALVDLSGHRVDRGDLLVSACVATPIPGWVEDMRPSIEGRLAAFAITSAERLAGGDLEARPLPGAMALFPRGVAGAAPVGFTRTFLGFAEGPRVVTCFATCLRPVGAVPASSLSLPPSPRACDASVAGARLESAPPPAPGVALASIAWAIHHPHPALLWAGISSLALAGLAMAWRKRPRSRI